MTTAFAIIAAIIALSGLLAAYHVGRQHERQHNRIAALEQQVKELQACQPKRHTLRTTAGIEDATAIAVDLAFEAKALEARLENLREVLGILRQGPHSYDPNRPAGHRFERED